MTTKHTEEFKRETVRIALSSGLSQERVAADMGIGKSMLSKWIARYRTADAVIEPQADLAKENGRLRSALGEHEIIGELLGAAWPTMHLGGKKQMNPRSFGI